MVIKSVSELLAGDARGGEECDGGRFGSGGGVGGGGGSEGLKQIKFTDSNSCPLPPVGLTGV